MDESFKIKGEYIELTKLLKATGLCGTGGMAKLVIEDRLVKVDDETETRKRKKIKKGQKISFNGYTIEVI